MTQTEKSKRILQAEEQFKRAQANLARAKREEKEKLRKEQDRHKYMMGGCVVKYFPKAYDFTELEMNRIIACAFSLKDVKNMIATVLKERQDPAVINDEEEVENDDLEKVFDESAEYETGHFADQKLDMLLDIQEIIAKGKGPGYERWAKIHNVKEMAQTLLFLEKADLRDYEKLAPKAGDASERFGEITERQKELEARLVEIASLKKHIINYSKTKDTYAEYRKSGYSKKFIEEHREEITLHKRQTAGSVKTAQLCRFFFKRAPGNGIIIDVMLYVFLERKSCSE